MGLLDQPDFCTLYAAVDSFFIDKLLHSFPTWLLCHPELLNMPIQLMYDADPSSERQLRADDPRFRRLGEIWADYRRYHRSGRSFYLRVVPWVMPGATSQRERMLTALVHGVAELRTPWYLKLDADTYATEPKGFYYDRWFRGQPVFIANPWGYTKPGDALDRLNRWAASIDELSSAPGYPVVGQLVGRGDDPSWKVCHRRMASWVMFGRTDWCVSTLRHLDDDLRLPFPSQDTYFSYLAEVGRHPFILEKFRRFGWEHCRNPNGLAMACKKVIDTHRRADR